MILRSRNVEQPFVSQYLVLDAFPSAAEPLACWKFFTFLYHAKGGQPCLSILSQYSLKDPFRYTVSHQSCMRQRNGLALALTNINLLFLPSRRSVIFQIHILSVLSHWHSESLIWSCLCFFPRPALSLDLISQAQSGCSIPSPACWFVVDLSREVPRGIITSNYRCRLKLFFRRCFNCQWAHHSSMISEFTVSYFIYALIFLIQIMSTPFRIYIQVEKQALFVFKNHLDRISHIVLSQVFSRTLYEPYYVQNPNTLASARGQSCQWKSSLYPCPQPLR